MVSNATRHRARAAALMIGAIMSRPLFAQTPTVTITGAPTDSQYRVVVDTVTRIDLSQALDLDEPAGGAVDSQGRIFLLGLNNTAPIFVFDKSGNFVKQLGRVGEGPGEYRMINSIAVTAGDTLRVVDDILG